LALSTFTRRLRSLAPGMGQFQAQHDGASTR
jgi:hypothetical protein